MAQDTAASDNVTGSADVLVAAGLADPQYGYANFLETFNIRIPDADYYNMGTIAAGTSGTIYVGGALDEISVFVVQFNEDGSQVVATGNGLEGQAIFTADPTATTWTLNFTAGVTGTYFAAVVDQVETDAVTGAVPESVPYVLASDLATAEAQSASYQGGSNALTGTSGAEGSFLFDGSDGGGTTIDPDDGEGIVELAEITGNNEPEQIEGAEIAELILGLAGNDTIIAGGGADVVYGNQGDDVLYGNIANDVLYGGQNVDIIFGGQDDDVLYGNFQDDIAYGNFANDLIFGGQGNDIAFGGQGNDTILGNKGDDILFGNKGVDQLTGNAGADQFALTANQGADIVTDFDIAEGDQVLALTDFTVSEVNGNVVLDATIGDGQLTLVGVDLASFNSALPVSFG